MKVIPDSSFFICFIDDLEGHLPFDERIRILTTITGNFSVILVPEVEEESPLQRLPQVIMGRFARKNPTALYRVPDQSIELLRPLLGRGEHAVITCAFLHHRNGDNEFFFILDDGLARDLIGRILPVLTNNMKGSIGFFGECACRKVLEKDDVIHLLTVLRKTKFRVDPSIITAIIGGIKSRCP